MKNRGIGIDLLEQRPVQTCDRWTGCRHRLIPSHKLELKYERLYQKQLFLCDVVLLAHGMSQVIESLDANCSLL